MLLQVIQSELYTIRYSWLKFRENFSFLSDTKRKGVFKRATIKGAISHDIANTPAIHLHQYSLLALWADRPDCTTHYEAGHEYFTFDLYSSPALTSELNALFPDVSSIIQSKDVRQLCNQPSVPTRTLYQHRGNTAERLAWFHPGEFYPSSRLT